MGKNYFAVFGLGAFGTYLALELERCGNHVTVVDLDRDLVNDIRDKVSEAVVGDISNEEVIREMNVRKFTAVILAFSINYACYFSEIYRGGIESIPQGQYEAGQVLGLTRWQIFRKIVLLQVVKRILAPMSNEVITLVKDTSLARIIAVYEIIYMGQSFIKKGLIWPLFYTGAFYLIFSGGLTILFDKLEKKLDYFRG